MYQCQAHPYNEFVFPPFPKRNVSKKNSISLPNPVLQLCFFSHLAHLAIVWRYCTQIPMSILGWIVIRGHAMKNHHLEHQPTMAAAALRGFWARGDFLPNQAHQRHRQDTYNNSYYDWFCLISRDHHLVGHIRRP